ncbi:hypothetical protein GQ42DRAFT_161514 [Ramicandelaber brevisporus]|nr:hypothetical protein GQ42DRAFT_161514 [Ramicandelaber brevisporus]
MPNASSASAFIPASGFDTARLRGTLLVVPTVSIGNVPQLSTDLLINTLRLDRIGYLDEPTVVPYAGSQAFDHLKSSGVNTALEVYQTSDAKVTFIQQRSFVHRGAGPQFAANIAGFAKQNGISQVLLLSSADASIRGDGELNSGLGGNSAIYHILPKNDGETRLVSSVKQVVTTPFELSHPADSKKSVGSEAVYPAIPGAGATRFLISAFQSASIPLAALVTYAAEGDNIPDAINLASTAYRILSDSGSLSLESPLTEFKPPGSWDSAMYAGKPPQILYQ